MVISSTIFLRYSSFAAIDVLEDDGFEDVVVQAELAFLAALTVLGAKAAKELEGFEEGIAGLAVQRLAVLPNTVDEESKVDCLLGVVEHYGVGPAVEGVGEDLAAGSMPGLCRAASRRVVLSRSLGAP